jgi:hypothetical protein
MGKEVDSEGKKLKKKIRAIFRETYSFCLNFSAIIGPNNIRDRLYVRPVDRYA